VRREAIFSSKSFATVELDVIGGGGSKLSGFWIMRVSKVSPKITSDKEGKGYES
jgi:hypothetical protein